MLAANEGKAVHDGAHLGRGCEMLATVFGSKGGVKSVSSATTGPTAPSFTTVSTFSSVHRTAGTLSCRAALCAR